MSVFVPLQDYVLPMRVDHLYNSFDLPSHMYCDEHLDKGPRHDTYHENGRFETMVHRSSLQQHELFPWSRFIHPLTCTRV